MKHVILFLILMLSMAGCTIDHYYPKLLHGSINNGVYTTTIGKERSAFWVAVPQESNKFETPYLYANEYIDRNYTYVSFGPTASDATIYRIFVRDKFCGLPVWAFKDINLPIMINIAAKGYDRQWFKIYQERILVNGHPALYQVYKQTMASPYLYVSRQQPGDLVLTHAFYFIDYGRYGVIIWIQASSQSGIFSVDEKNRWQIIDRVWMPAVRFTRSLVVNYIGHCGLLVSQ